jgi:hypothetical protein
LISREIVAAASLDAVELAEYRSHLDASYNAYLSARTETYGLERRWRTPFWQRRLVAVSVVPACPSCSSMALQS